MSRCNRYIDESSHTDPCRLPQSQSQRKAAVFQSKILPRCQNPPICGFVPFGKSYWGVPSPNPAMRPIGRERRSTTLKKKYNTPHRRHVVKTRMTEEEYADFTAWLAVYDISQAEFIRQAITRATSMMNFAVRTKRRRSTSRPRLKSMFPARLTCSTIGRT